MEDLEEYYRGYAAIDLDAIYYNMEQMKANIHPDTKMIAVIKTDGYGHGAVPIAKVIDDLVAGYAVATLPEALNLRKHKIQKPIYILGFTHESQCEAVIRNEIRPAVFEYKMAKKYSEMALQTGITAKLDIAVDTGMSRIGFADTEDSLCEIEKIASLPGIEIESIFTHFFASDEKDKTSAKMQLQRFRTFVGNLEERGIVIPIHQCSNSAGIIDLPEANMDRVRAGISIYGMYPSEEVNKQAVSLKPALSLKSHIIYLKEVAENTGISYGATYRTTRKTKVATIPLGYGDGYPRNLSNCGYVLIRGQKAPILGRVCMDQFMVDVTDVEGVSEGDVVTLVGKDGDLEIRVEELAALAQTFNYEFVCNLGKRIPRVYYRHQKRIGTKDYYEDDYCFG